MKPVGKDGLNPDYGTSGQRLGPDVAIVLKAKGLNKTLECLVRDSIEPGALRMTRRLLGCLQNHA